MATSIELMLEIAVDIDAKGGVVKSPTGDLIFWTFFLVFRFKIIINNNYSCLFPFGRLEHKLI